MKKIRKETHPLEADVLALLQNRPMKMQQLARVLHLPSAAHKRLASIFRTLAANGEIIKDRDGNWGVPASPITVEGQFLASPSGGGRVRLIPPGTGPDIRISAANAAGAWHRDIVRAVIVAGSDGSAGKIVDIIERKQQNIPAILEERHKRSWIFRPAEGRDRHYFLVRPTPGMKPAPGTLAILKPLAPLKGKHRDRDIWDAELLSLEGPGDRISAQETIVKENHDVPRNFPQLALEQAANLPDAPSEQDMEGREDVRHKDFVTIDGADARDFDDAIHVEKVGDEYVLSVAIADVSHYVKPDGLSGSLDGEAVKRGNSWYFPTSVEPMLPQSLSNGLCSLNPHVDRLAMMVQMRFDKNGNLLGEKIAPVVMNSKKRLTYDQVASFIEGDGSHMPEENLGQMLGAAHELYKILAHKRKKRGTLDFILPEPKYEFDSDGHLVGMKVADRNDAHRLIEEFMIAANETVASWLGRKKIPFLYRVHPAPEAEKLLQLFNGLRAATPEVLPPEFLKAGTSDPAAIQTILANAADTPQEFVVNRLCLRSMGQARYQPGNLGHFGLASDAYCHFTSPIRRYADLLVHRAVKAALKNDPASTPDEESLANTALGLNALERRAIDAEREMAKRMSCLALEGKEGRKMEGAISAITDFGIFMEFDEIPTDGLIRLEDLGDDWFECDATRQLLMGTRSGKVFRIGDPITATIKNVDMNRLEIHMQMEPPKKLQSPHANRRQKKFDGSGAFYRNRKK